MSRLNGFLAAVLFALGAGLAARASAAAPQVIIDPGGAPAAALQAATTAVDAIVRLAQDQDLREVHRLRRRAIDAAQAALRTQGYFESQVELEVSEASGAQPEFWEISIRAGEQSSVRHVGLKFSGALAADSWAERRQDLRDGWQLPVGAPFINDDWAAAKTDLLDSVAREEFYFASFASSRARVDARKSAVDLDIDIDSGPPVRLGQLRISGLKRVPASLVERYVRYQPGDPYNQDLLDQWQQTLQSTVFFRGAFVTLDDGQNEPEPAGAAALSSEQALQLAGQALEAAPERAPAPANDAAAAPSAAPEPLWSAENINEPLSLPVHVRVTEAIARSFRGSIGADSDHGIRAEGMYQQNIFLGLPVWIETGLGVDTRRQRAFFDVHLPPDLNSAHDSFGVLYDHSDIEGLENSRAALAWRRNRDFKLGAASRVDYQSRWSLMLSYDKTRIAGAQRYEVPAWMASWQVLRRDVDDIYNPRSGNLLELGLGGGTTLDDAKPYYRASLRGQYWWPIGAQDVLSARAEIGRAWSHTERLPQDFYWRTGGARSIRGYRYQSIGATRGSAVVGAPVLGVLGLEYTHYFNDLLGANVFLDAGDAAASVASFDWHLGYGAGVAVRTPAGPFYLDLAWADKDRRLRLQFSLGIAF